MKYACSLVVLAAACGEPPAKDPATDPSPPLAPASSVTASADAGSPPSSACAFLARTCHAHDKASETAHACHKLGHAAASEEECEAKRAECTAACSGGEPHH